MWLPKKVDYEIISLLASRDVIFFTSNYNYNYN